MWGMAGDATLTARQYDPDHRRERRQPALDPELADRTLKNFRVAFELEQKIRRPDLTDWKFVQNRSDPSAPDPLCCANSSREP